jgi:cobalamin biosynthesis protein CobD/CbiB
MEHIVFPFLFWTALLCVLGILLGIPLAAILTHHQRKMAEIIHRGRQPLDPGDVESLRQEVAQLRDRLSEQTLTLGDIASAIERLQRRSLDAPQASTHELGARTGQRDAS